MPYMLQCCININKNELNYPNTFLNNEFHVLQYIYQEKVGSKQLQFKCVFVILDQKYIKSNVIIYKILIFFAFPFRIGA